jgi:hypothetical protein
MFRRVKINDLERRLTRTMPGCGIKNRGRVETQPRFKIQYPMKNHGKYEINYANLYYITELFFSTVILP